MRKTVLVVASMASAMLVACLAAAVIALPGSGRTAPAFLVGAGDISRCSPENRDSATAKLLGNLPGTVMALGDNVYPDGRARNFRDCYDPTWGRYKRRTKPAVGNHDYDNTAAAGPYFNYFGARAGTPGKGYYSYDLKNWHVVVLNSNCDRVGGCGLDSPQGRWLRNDLRRNQAGCTLAYFHHPLYASGNGTATPQVKPFWNVLYDRGAEVILSGHAHRYERYAKITPEGRRDRGGGIRQFVVGTGGEPGGTEVFREDAPNMQVVKTDVYGVLRLSLRADSYAWRFVPIAGKTFTDTGKGRCN